MGAGQGAQYAFCMPVASRRFIVATVNQRSSLARCLSPPPHFSAQYFRKYCRRARNGCASRAAATAGGARAPPAVVASAGPGRATTLSGRCQACYFDYCGIGNNPAQRYQSGKSGHQLGAERSLHAYEWCTTNPTSWRVAGYKSRNVRLAHRRIIVSVASASAGDSTALRGG